MNNRHGHTGAAIFVGTPRCRLRGVLKEALAIFLATLDDYTLADLMIIRAVSESASHLAVCHVYGALKPGQCWLFLRNRLAPLRLSERNYGSVGQEHRAQYHATQLV
jgi:hypothetical protein